MMQYAASVRKHPDSKKTISRRCDIDDPSVSGEKDELSEDFFITIFLKKEKP
jgi:hypothetical protein